MNHPVVKLKKPYFVVYGQLTKKDVNKTEDCLYNSMALIPYNDKLEYEQQIIKLESTEYRVTKR